MIEIIVNKITLRAFEQQVIKKEDMPVFRYGLVSMIEISIILFTMLLASKWLGRINEGGILVGTIMICRSFGGGYHAKSFMDCYFISVSVFLVTTLFLNLMPSEWYDSAIITCSICSVFFIIVHSRIEAKIKRKQFGFLNKVMSYIRVLYFTLIVITIYFEIINASVLACSLGFCIAQLSTLIRNKEVNCS